MKASNGQKKRLKCHEVEILTPCESACESSCSNWFPETPPENFTTNVFFEYFVLIFLRTDCMTAMTSEDEVAKNFPGG